MIKNFKLYSGVKTTVEKYDFPKGTRGAVVHRYPNTTIYEIEIFDENHYPIDVFTYDESELEEETLN